MIWSFFYYVFFSSVVLYYGLALNRTTIGMTWSSNILTLVLSKMFFSVMPTVMLTYFLAGKILVPLGLVSLLPFVVLLIFLTVSAFVEVVINIAMRQRITEFAVSYLICLLTIYESVSVLDMLLIPIWCMLSFVIAICLLHAVTLNAIKRDKHNDFMPKKALAIFSLAIIIIITLVFDVTWLNEGALR